MNRYDRPELAPYFEVAQGYAEAVRVVRSHTGVAIGAGPLTCPSCEEPWPCRELRRAYPGLK